MIANRPGADCAPTLYDAPGHLPTGENTMKTKTIQIDAELFKTLREIANLTASGYAGDYTKPFLWDWKGRPGRHWLNWRATHKIRDVMKNAAELAHWDARCGGIGFKLRSMASTSEIAMILLAREIVKASGGRVKKLPDISKRKWNPAEDYDVEPESWDEENDTHRDRIKRRAGEVIKYIGGLEADVWRVAESGNPESAYADWGAQLDYIKESIDDLHGAIADIPKDDYERLDEPVNADNNEDEDEDKDE